MDFPFFRDADSEVDQSQHETVGRLGASVSPIYVSPVRLIVMMAGCFCIAWPQGYSKNMLSELEIQYFHHTKLAS